MKNGVLTLAATAAVLFGLTASANAQATPAATQKPATSAATTTTMPTFELGAGYQFLRTGQVCDDDAISQTCTPNRSFPIGVAVDGVRNFGAIGIVGEGGWSYDSDTQDVVASPAFGLDFKTNIWHLAGGARFTSRKNPKIWPYGQLLAGVVGSHISGDAVDVLNGESVSNTSFMLQPGAGATFAAGDGWGIFGQVDYRRVFLNVDEDEIPGSFSNLSDGRNDFRFFIGFRMILD